MFELLFLIVFVLFPFLTIFSYKFFLKENILRVSIVNFLVINIFIFAYVGVIFLFFHLDPLRVSNGVVDREIIFLVWLFSVISITSIIVGAFFSKKTFNMSSLIFNPKLIDKITNLQRIKSYIFIFLGGIALFLYIKAVPEIALFNIFSFDGKSGIQNLRSDMGNNFEGSYLLYNIFMRDILQLLLFVFYSQWLVFNNKKDLSIVIFLFLISSFVALMATEKAPIIWLIVGMFLVNVIIKRSFIPVKEIIKITVPIFIILIIMYMFFMKSTSVSQAFNSVLSRAFTGSITPAYFYLDLFPEYHEYLYGKSFPNPKGILPYEPVKLPVLVMNWVNPHLESLGIVGSMPTVFWAEIYANFGPLMIAPISFIIGFLLNTLDLIIFKLRKNSLYVGYYVWVILYFRELSITSFSNFMLNIVLIIVTFIFIFISMKNYKINYSK